MNKYEKKKKKRRRKSVLALIWYYQQVIYVFSLSTHCLNTGSCLALKLTWVPSGIPPYNVWGHVMSYSASCVQFIHCCLHCFIWTFLTRIALNYARWGAVWQPLKMKYLLVFSQAKSATSPTAHMRQHQASKLTAVFLKSKAIFFSPLSRSWAQKSSFHLVDIKPFIHTCCLRLRHCPVYEGAASQLALYHNYQSDEQHCYYYDAISVPKKKKQAQDLNLTSYYETSL